MGGKGVIGVIEVIGDRGNMSSELCPFENPSNQMSAVDEAKG